MKIALTQACLKVKCYFCFLLSQTTLFSQQILPKRSFGESFSGAFFQKGAVLWVVLRSCGLLAGMPNNRRAVVVVRQWFWLKIRVAECNCALE